MRFSTLADFVRRNGRGLLAGCFFFMTWGTFAGNNPPPLQRKNVRDESTIRCALPAGATSFVVRMKDLAQQRRLTLVNENGAAAGELFVAVSDEQLRESDPGWRPVTGTIRFHDKQRFTFSLVGVEAEYVKLTVRVQARGRSL